jgi:hypothetical protein
MNVVEACVIYIDNYNSFLYYLKNKNIFPLLNPLILKFRAIKQVLNIIGRYTKQPYTPPTVGYDMCRRSIEWSRCRYNRRVMY